MILKPRLFRKPNLGHRLSRGLVGLWLMNEGSGSIVFDLSGNGNTGTLTGTAPVWDAGKFGSAVNFPGTDEHIIAPSPITIDDKYTVLIWFNITTHAVDKGLFSIADTVSSTIPIMLIQADNGDLKIYNGGYATISSINTNQWYCVAVSFDGTDAFVYLDGVYKTSRTKSGGTQDNNIYIGNGYNGYITGLVSSVMIYNRTLTASEIAQLYQEPFCMFERELIELWSAATLGGIPPVGNAGIMTTNTGFWGATF